jgi:hypothetical protein
LLCLLSLSALDRGRESERETRERRNSFNQKINSKKMTLRGPRLDSDIDETPPKPPRAHEEEEEEAETHQRRSR